MNIPSELVGTIVTIIMAAIGGFVAWGRVTTRIDSLTVSVGEMQAKFGQSMDALTKLTTTVEKFSVVLVGLDGSNGMRSEINDNRQKIAVLDERLREIETKVARLNPDRRVTP
jgi:hypothetical protein